MSATQEQIEHLRQFAAGIRSTAAAGMLDPAVKDGAPLIADALDALLREREELRAQVDKWERKEITRASACCGQEERADAAEAKLAEAQREIERLRAGWDDAARAAGRLASDNVKALQAKDARVRELEAVLREKELAAADAMALILSHEGHIEKLEAQLADEQEQHRLGVLNAEAQLQAAHDSGDRWMIAAEAAEAQLTRLREAHKRLELSPGHYYIDVRCREFCETCMQPWPCKSAKLLAEADKGGSDA